VSEKSPGEDSLLPEGSRLFCGVADCELFSFLCSSSILKKGIVLIRGSASQNPCAIATHTKCAGFDACCPPNTACQLVGGGISCMDLVSRRIFFAMIEFPRFSLFVSNQQLTSSTARRR